MMTHVHGTGDHAYPEQDPRDISARIIREGFERIVSAQGRLSAANDRYTSAAIRGDAKERGDRREEQQRAAFTLGKILRQVEEQCLEIAEGAEVVTQTPRGGDG